MTKSVPFFSVAHWLAKHTQVSGRYAGLFLALSIFLLSMAVSACNGPSSSAAPGSTPSPVALSQIKWCGKPLMIFRDEGATTTTPQSNTIATTVAGTPKTISDWSVIQANLGFTLYLPATLDSGTCLLNVQATIHDQLFGSSFVISYLLPNHTSLSVSEAPLLSQGASFQCHVTSTATPTPGENNGTPSANATTQALPTQLCSGAKKTTYLAISGSGSVAQLQQTFDHLQANVNWIPAS